MARVIKAGAGQKPPRAQPRVVLDAGPKKTIGRELYQAKQDAEHILMRAEQERQQRLAEGKKQAAQAREEAMAQGASEAFAAAAAEALAAFRRRAERYAEAAEDIRALALEVVKKVLGADPDLSPKDIDIILSRGLAQLRARRRLRLQVSAERLESLSFERPNLMKALDNEPDLVIEAADDVNDGFARVVTEIGGALCAEDTALDELARAVNVKETPRTASLQAGAPGGATDRIPAQHAPTTTHEVRRARSLDISNLPSARVEEVELGGDSELAMRPPDVERTLDLRNERRRAARDDRSDLRADDASDEQSDELSDDRSAEDIPEIDADEDDGRTEARPHAPTAIRAAARPQTRVVPLADRAPPPDDDLDLFTDDAPRPSKKKR